MPQSKKQKVSVYEPPAPAAAAHAPPSHSNCIGRIRATPSNCNGPSIAVSVGPKLPQFKPTDKLVVLDWHHAHGHNQKATAAHFQREPQYNKLNQGTISRWLQAEAKIREAVASASSPKENNTVKCCSHNAATREKSLKHPELEKCLILWLDRLDTAQRARLTGKEIKVTARQIYDELEVSEPDRLKLSNGWLSRFQARHGLKLHRRYSSNLVGSGEIDIEAERKRIQDDVRVFLDRHGSLNDVWGMEMTTVLLECSPMKAAYAGSDGGKPARITVGLIVSASGKERLEPIFVGHNTTRQKSLQYSFNNRMACMTSSIVLEWLHAWNKTLVESNRHVLLLVSHSWGRWTDGMAFSNVQLRFISASATDHLSPYSLGLTKAFHTQFRKLVVQRALGKLRSNQDEIIDGSALFEMGDDGALELAKAAWQIVAPGSKLAASCWRKTQILPPKQNLLRHLMLWKNRQLD